VNPALVGDYAIGTTVGQFYDAATGTFASPTGNRETYRILLDGRYEHTYFKQVRSYGCVSRIFLYELGVARTLGDVVQFMSTGGATRGEDSCNPRYNYQRAVLPGAVVQTYWSVRHQYGGVYLQLGDARRSPGPVTLLRKMR
jgi:hypothetical protein